MAHSLAKYGLSLNSETVWIEEPPFVIADALLLDGST